MALLRQARATFCAPLPTIAELFVEAGDGVRSGQPGARYLLPPKATSQNTFNLGRRSECQRRIGTVDVAFPAALVGDHLAVFTSLQSHLLHLAILSHLYRAEGKSLAKCTRRT